MPAPIVAGAAAVGGRLLFSALMRGLAGRAAGKLGGQVAKRAGTRFLLNRFGPGNTKKWVSLSGLGSLGSAAWIGSSLAPGTDPGQSVTGNLPESDAPRRNALNHTIRELNTSFYIKQGQQNMAPKAKSDEQRQLEMLLREYGGIEGLMAQITQQQ